MLRFIRIPHSPSIVHLIIVGVLVAGLLALQPTHSAYAATCSSNGSGNWDSTSTWSCGAVPGAGDTVVIQPEHTINLTTTQDALDLLNYGTLNMNANSFRLYGNYYNYTGQVIGGGTFNTYGDAGTDLCLVSQSDFSGTSVNFAPASSGSVSCSYGMNAGGIWVAQGTLTLGGNSAFGWINVYANAMLDTSTISATCSGTVTNNGTIRATRNSPGASSTTFGLAGGTGSAFVVQPLTGGFSSLILDWHGEDHAFKTGTGVSSGVGWGEYWILSVTGSDNARVTIPTQFTPDSNSKVCYHVSSTTWNCAQTSFDAVSTPNTVTRNPVSVATNLAFAAGNVGPTAVVLNSLTASAKPITPTGIFGLALSGLLALGIFLFLVPVFPGFLIKFLFHRYFYR